MRFFTTFALTSAALVSSVLADNVLNERHIQARDSQSFTPTTQTASGDTCADAFGAGYVVCRDATGDQNRLCYNPTAGQTCCSNTWACPSGSFCFTNGNCCPNGLSQSACAAQLSSASTTSAPPKAAVTTSVPNTTTSSYSAGTSVPYPAKNVTIIPSGTGTANPTTAPAAQFTGAASSLSLEMGVAAIGGVAAIFAALL